jgi:diadenosine tetraphosphate (Ap4A) HIT family hydrolase
LTVAGPVDCIFCQIVAGRAAASLVYADDLVLAFCDIEPFTAGHTLVVPRRHATGLSDLDDASAGRMFEAGRRIAASARAALACPGVNLFLADGAAAWQTVFHVHLHVIPRWGRSDGMQLRARRAHPARTELDRVAHQLAAQLSA